MDHDINMPTMTSSETATQVPVSPYNAELIKKAIGINSSSSPKAQQALQDFLRVLQEAREKDGEHN